MKRPIRRRQARQKLSRRFQNKIPAPRKLVRSKPGARGVSLALLVVGAWLIYLFATSDLFYVTSVSVEGNSSVPNDEIAKASGALNYNIFFLQFSQVENRVRALTAVRDARVAYQWPDTLRVVVTERKPVFVWESNKKSAWVDDTGQVFPSRAALTNTLTIRDLDNQTRATLDLQLVKSAQAIIAALPTLKRLDYSDAKGLSFVDEHNWRVMLGQPEQVSAKLAMLQSLSSYLVAQKIDVEYVDVRLPERAFYKPK